MTDVPLKCKCGKVKGMATGVSPASGNHGRCTCIDCRAFIRFLERAEILDEDGGTELFQFTPSQIQITFGGELLRCVRLSPKGMIRWFTDCCKTPMGNTMPWPRLPFVGMPILFMDFAALGKRPEDILGPITMTGFENQATRPVAKVSGGVKVKVLGKMFWILGTGFVLGRAQPSPFFKADGTTTVPPTLLTKEERGKLADS